MAAVKAPASAGGGASKRGERFVDNTKKKDVRELNIEAAKAVADSVRTSLGPRGLDKMVAAANGEVLITNDGATILNKMNVTQPAAKMLVELAKSQDVVAGDGTTSVVVICGALLKKAQELLSRGVHPTVISDAFQKAVDKANVVLEGVATPVDLADKDALVRAATTSLSSKVVSQYSSLLSPMAVDAVLRVMDPARPNMLDLRDIKVVSKVGGTIDDSELVEGCVFDSKMDRVYKEERNYILGLVKKIRASGCNVLLVQKSILRDAVTDLSLHYLGCLPIAHPDHMRPEKLGSAELVEEVECGKGRVVRVTGIAAKGRTATVLLRGSNRMVLDEADRSLHDALCCIRCLVQKRFMIAGGSAPEVEVTTQLSKWAKTLQGMEAYCVRAFAEALEVVPFTLAENAGLNPIAIVTELRQLHAEGNPYHGINVKKGTITDMREERVVQPLLVTSSALTLATECVRMILKIDDIVPTR
ncbi:T-complex 1 subunit delta [Raphidocelis subcapitata]|uniref:T-complex protein 1 subunit delta n=1 Tax=Raphidocelis subcapitata TaxID=307507 RepID=A0A2V0PGD0_9CHLO|nr:T-complex 1 subunit delta [Raphidocelis subcapitata]|eukprot:GBF98904.1 T-complex 1 subunit delta [Raphidocelis subcapitata]